MLAGCIPKKFLDAILSVPWGFFSLKTLNFWGGGMKFGAVQCPQKYLQPTQNKPGHPQAALGFLPQKEAGGGGFFFRAFQGIFSMVVRKKNVILAAQLQVLQSSKLPIWCLWPSTGREKPPKSFISYLGFLKAPNDLIIDLKNPIISLFSNNL